MLIRWLQKSAVAVCDLSNVAMFWIFSNPAWIKIFTTSSLRFVLFPAIAISVATNGVIDIINFSKTHNKNILSVTGVITSIIGAMGAVIANGGGLIAALFFSAGFPPGVYFILTGVATGFVFHLSQAIIKLTRYLHAPNFDSSLTDQKQMIALHTFYVAMLSCIFLGLLFTTLVPITTIFPALTIGFFLTDCIWSALLPESYKGKIKQFVGLSEPSEIPQLSPEQLSNEINNVNTINSSLKAFFQPTMKQDLVKAHLCNQDKDSATTYLLEEVTIKKRRITKIVDENPDDLKHQHKLSVLKHIESHLTEEHTLTHDSLNNICETHYLAKQSFFSMAEGDMGDIIEATKLHIN